MRHYNEGVIIGLRFIHAVKTYKISLTVNQEEEITKGSQRIVLVNNLIINRCSVYVGLQSLYYKVVRNLALSSLCRILAHIADLEEKGKTNLYLLKLKKKKSAKTSIKYLLSFRASKSVYSGDTPKFP